MQNVVHAVQAPVHELHVRLHDIGHELVHRLVVVDRLGDLEARPPAVPQFCVRVGLQQGALVDGHVLGGRQQQTHGHLERLEGAQVGLLAHLLDQVVPVGHELAQQEACGTE